MSATIAPATTVGSVHLTVSDLERSLAYYTRAIGLDVLASAPGRAVLGGSRELVVLVEEPGARPVRGATGLFHLALLVPERVDLARFLAHVVRDRVPLQGLSDHVVSEAVYLADPDGHGIEVYADRARDLWEGEVGRRLTTLPLDVDALLAELDDPQGASFEGLPAGTRMGHVHLCVATIPEAVAFYRDVVGFELMAALGAEAAFLSAGGYHHHVGANTWTSRGGAPPPPGSAALRHATIILPDEIERDRLVARLEQAGRRVDDDADGPLVRDPSGNALVLAVEGSLGAP